MTRGVTKLLYYIITRKVHPAYLYVYIKIANPCMMFAWHACILMRTFMEMHMHPHTRRCVRTVTNAYANVHTRAKTDRTSIR